MPHDLGSARSPCRELKLHFADPDRLYPSQADPHRLVGSRAQPHLQLVVRVSLAPALGAVVGHRIAKLNGGARGLIAVVVHPEGTVVAARHVSVRREPHLHARHHHAERCFFLDPCTQTFQLWQPAIS